MSKHAISGIDDISATWLTGVYTDIGYLKDQRVTDLSVSDIGVGRGFISQTVKIEAEYDRASDAPSSAVAKIPSIVGFPDETRDVMGAILEAEVNWYRFAAEQCPVRVPICHTADYQSPERYVLLLEDLSSYDTLNQADEMDDDLARMAVRSLARIHSHWWKDAELQKSNWLRSPEVTLELAKPLIEGGWDHFAEIALRVDPSFVPVGEKFVAGLDSLLTRGVDTSGTMVHGDFRSENFLVGEGTDDNDLVILDWQVCFYGSGLYDLGYFISQSLSTEKRRNLEKELLSLYYDELLKGGVTDFSERQFKEDYKLGLLASLVIPINAAKMAKELIPPDESAPDLAHQQFREGEAAMNALMALMSERSIHAVMDNDAGDIL